MVSQPRAAPCNRGAWADPTHARAKSPANRQGELSVYLRGWRGYFGFCQTPSVLRAVDEWTRRRLRAIAWQQWKRGPARFAELRRRGVGRDLAARSSGRVGLFIRFLSIGPRLCSTLPSDPASRRHPCGFANPSPPSGWIEDSHLQAVDHARHTRRTPPKPAGSKETGCWRNPPYFRGPLPCCTLPWPPAETPPCAAAPALAAGRTSL